jgi:soluble lytic murein transglycosylase
VATVVADQWGWHDQAIHGFTRTGYMDDINRRFPVAYQDLLQQQAEKQNIDPAWALAIARRESAFMTDAHSGAGARGLMQLLPSTAKYLAGKKVSNRALYDPKINVQYGTQYLRYLLGKLDDNAILATASYNAGWRRVKQWLPDTQPMQLDIWVETIPFRETRNYVKAVTAYQQIYAHQLGKTKHNLFEQWVDMKIPTAR